MIIRRIILLLSLALTGLHVWSQCPSGSASNTTNFTTQAQIDAFPINFPNCTHVPTGISISEDNITNLNGLAAITSIAGELRISGNGLTNLNGLNALTTIGGQFVFGFNHLTNFTGLNALTSIGGTFIIQQSSNLTSLNGLNALSNVGGQLAIYYNPALTSLTGLGALSHVGQLFIQYNAALTSLTGLESLSSIQLALILRGNTNLMNLTALSNLNSIGGQLEVTGSNNLNSLVGLGNIQSSGINYLRLSGPQLSICEVQSICNYLATPSNAADITGATGCATRAEVEMACLVTLPVELVCFTGKAAENNTILSWQTASEQNNDYFQIEHSLDGRQFNSIGSVKSYGNSTDPQSYKFVHPNPSAGVHYYRLKQVDLDGKHKYSKTISINIDSDEISLFPNPTTGIVEIQGKNAEQPTIRLTDHIGRFIKTQKLSDSRQIDLGSLPNGIYFVEILTDTQSIVKRIIKE